MPDLVRTPWRFDEGCVAAAIAGGIGALGFGDGKVELIPFADPRMAATRQVAAHRGSVLALADLPDGRIVSGGDDGRVVAISPSDGTVVEVLAQRGRQFDTIAVTHQGWIALGFGKEVRVLAGDGRLLATLGPHDSTVAALHVRGRWLAAAHYNGVTLWDLEALEAPPRRLSWKGSHLAVAISPDAGVLCTATQDGEVHAWRLTAEGEMRMSGYGVKVRDLSWSPDGLWLAAAGVPLLHAWPFDGPGPEGRAPLDLFDGGEVGVSRVAFHPFLPLLAGGYADGRLVLADLAAKSVRGGELRVSKREITCLLWSRDGQHLIAGAADGKALTQTLPLPVGLTR
ncbi:MAG: WD40 repeat domain-containing protein [Alphaproteobacteria bacterium]|nr:WD40 repeat domain-containing protein [Alphaproteobacteria bacterium]